jgi:hypothetical protein
MDVTKFYFSRRIRAEISPSEMRDRYFESKIIVATAKITLIVFLKETVYHKEVIL